MCAFSAKKNQKFSTKKKKHFKKTQFQVGGTGLQGASSNFNLALGCCDLTRVSYQWGYHV